MGLPSEQKSNVDRLLLDDSQKRHIMGSGFSRLRELDEYFRMDIGVAWLLAEYLDYPKGFASVYTVIEQETIQRDVRARSAAISHIAY